MSVIVKAHAPCTIGGGCGSSDGMTIYDDGLFCFACNVQHTFRGSEQADDYLNGEAPQRKQKTMAKGLQQRKTYAAAISDRNITKDTVKKYGVGLVIDEQRKVVQHVYPYHDKDGELVFQKVRTVEGKRFHSEGDNTAATLFGQKEFTPSSKVDVIVTEGELDALAAYQLQGSRFPAVSVRSSSEAVKNFENKDVWHWLMGFKHIVLCFDNDAAGKKATKAVCDMFPIGKVKVFKHQKGYKDACDYLKAQDKSAFMDGFFQSEEYRPEGFVSTAQMKDRLLNFKYEMGAPYPWESVNEKTYGIRTGEMVVVPARPGAGKTTAMRQICHHLHKELPEDKMGCVFLEESAERTCFGFMSLSMEKEMHKPDVEWTEDEFEAAWNDTMEDGRIVLYDEHDGSINLDKLKNTIYYYAHGLGAKYIFVDHIGRILVDGVSSQREQFEKTSKALSALCVELDIAIILAMHLNREGELFGSDGPLRDANVIMALHRDEDEETNTRLTPVEIQKNRLYGLEGDCIPLVMENGVFVEVGSDYTDLLMKGEE